MNNVTLPSGVNNQGRYIHISQVTSGATNLHCPYCNRLLTAKKGRRMAHHFAHTNETCLDIAHKDFEALNLPLYDRFNIYIDAKAWAELQRFHTESRYDAQTLFNHSPQLIRQGFGRIARYELTTEGKIPFGEATLNSFADIQIGFVYDRHKDLSEVCQNTYYGYKRFPGSKHWAIEPAPEQVPNNIADLNIYRSQVQRLYSLHMYLLEIKHTRGRLHKIGVSRDIERRISEIQRDLKPFIEVESIKVDRLCKNRGAVEHYALHRYSKHRAKVGPLTEYFQFDKKLLSNVRRDFTSLGNFDLPEDGNWWMENYSFDDDSPRHYPDVGRYSATGLIGQILTDETAWIQQQIEKDQLTKAISAGTKRGMQEAKEKGIHIGRPADTDDEIIQKYPDIVKELQKGQPIRVIARELGVSRNTVRKVRDAMNE